jgi:hypothetical protein
MSDKKLTPADTGDLAQSISFALRFSGRKRFTRAIASWPTSRPTTLSGTSDQCGYVVMKKPPLTGHGGPLLSGLKPRD